LLQFSFLLLLQIQFLLKTFIFKSLQKLALTDNQGQASDRVIGLIFPEYIKFKFAIMRRLIVLFIVLFVAVVFYFNREPEIYDNLPEQVETEQPIENVSSSTTSSEHSPDNFLADSVDSQIVNFNQYLSTRPEMDLLFGDDDPVQLFIESSGVTEERSSQFIDDILNNAEENQLSLRQLFLRCNKLKNEREKYTLGENLVYPNDILIYAMYKKGTCNLLGTKSDPFYTYLDLARGGDMLAQLLLIDDLGYAIDTGAINLNLQPLE